MWEMRGLPRWLVDPLLNIYILCYLFLNIFWTHLCWVSDLTHDKGLPCVQTALGKEIVCRPKFVVSSLSWVALDNPFAKCLWHLTNSRFPVVIFENTHDPTKGYLCQYLVRNGWVLIYWSMDQGVHFLFPMISLAAYCCAHNRHTLAYCCLIHLQSRLWRLGSIGGLVRCGIFSNFIRMSCVGI